MNWDSLSRRFTRAGQSVESKVKETASLLSLQQKQAVAKNKLDEVYRQIGLKYFDSCAEKPAEFEEVFSQVRQLRSEIAGIQGQINEIKGGKVCPNCGAQLSADARFCGKCGTKLPEDMPPQREKYEEAAEGAEQAAAEPQPETAVERDAAEPAGTEEGEPAASNDEGKMADTDSAE